MRARSIAAGSLRHKVEILSPSSVKDDHGQPTEIWITSGFRRAGIMQKGSASSEKSGAESAIATTHLILRWDNVTSKLSANNRIKKDGLLLKVVGQPDNYELLNRYVIVECKAINQ